MFLKSFLQISFHNCPVFSLGTIVDTNFTSEKKNLGKKKSGIGFKDFDIIHSIAKHSDMHYTFK